MNLIELSINSLELLFNLTSVDLESKLALITLDYVKVQKLSSQ